MILNLPHRNKTSRLQKRIFPVTINVNIEYYIQVKVIMKTKTINV
jgi:hypothetical protein